MSFARALGWVRALGIGTFFLLLSFALLNGLNSMRRASERSHVVQAAMAQQYSQLLLSGPSVDEAYILVRAQAGWPDEYINLQRWLIIDLARHQSPVDTLQRLDKLVRGHLISPVLQTSIDRWRSSLRAWAEQPGGLAPEMLIHQARRRFFEASGYQKIGRQYDATVLYLWAGSLFQRYVGLRPQGHDVAEVLFHVGASLMRLRHAISSVKGSERLLKLCAELYPSTIWAEQAISFWRLEKPSMRTRPTGNARADA